MKTLVIGLDGLTPLEKVAKALYIETKLIGNLTMPAPFPAIAVLTAARIKLEGFIAAALDGGKAAIFARNQAEAELDLVITQLAGYVQSIAGDNEALILGAGFDVRRSSSRIGPLPAPTNLRADLTDQVGQIFLDWDVVYGAREYDVQRNDTDPMVETNWKNLDSVTPSKYLDAGLASGSTHWYRVRARGTAGPSPWSDPARAMAR